MYLFLGCTYFPHRFFVAFMMFLGLTIVDVIRSSLTFTFNKISALDKNHLDECSMMVKSYGEYKQGLMVETFNYAYAICHVPGVMLNKQIGGKLAVGLGTFLISVLSILLPFAACYSMYTLFAIRITMGIFMGLMVSGLIQVVTQWSPLNERTLLVATVSAGSPVGILITWMMLVGNNNNLLDLITWQDMYKILGGVGIVWCILWHFLCYDKPSQHPYLSALELDYLKKYVPETQRNLPTPWIAIFKSKPVWALFIASIGDNFGYYTTISQLPTYYQGISKSSSSSQKRNWSVVAFILVYLGTILLGFLSDKIITLKWTTATHLRRLLTTIGIVGPAIGMVCASYLSDQLAQIIICTMFLTSLGFSLITLNVNSMDLSYNHAAVLLAINNGSGAASGAIASLVVEALLNRKNNNSCEDDKIIKWQDVCWVRFAVQVISIVPFLMFGSGQVQPWDKPRTDSTKRKLNGTSRPV